MATKLYNARAHPCLANRKGNLQARNEVAVAIGDVNSRSPEDLITSAIQAYFLTKNTYSSAKEQGIVRLNKER